MDKPPKPPPKPRTSLFVIQARSAPVAAILRRGPSKVVQLIRWNTARDTFEEGQWFKGRVYERRCDLSPDGNKLVYFAAKQRPPYYSWTAVSKLPFFTAVALWPSGTTYGGGGLFDSASSLALNHFSYNMALAEGFALPPSVKVRPLTETSGMNEDIYGVRLLRDGWTCLHPGEERENPHGSEVWIEYDPAIEYRKLSPPARRSPRRYELAMELKGIRELNGPWYVVEYKLRNDRGEISADLGRLEWADWDRNGDLLFARKGKLFRSRPETKPKKAWDASNAVELADFSPNRFDPQPPPESARRW